MKKLLALILTLAILSLSVFALAACNNNKPDDDDTSDTDDGGNKDKNDGSDKSRAIAAYECGDAVMLETYTILDKQDEIWFAFAPSESATYRIEVGLLEGNYSIQLLDSEGTNLLAEDKEIKYPLEANKKYYVKVLQFDGCDDNQFSLIIKKFIPLGDVETAIELVEGTRTTGTFTADYPNEVYFKFTPTEDGWYSVSYSYESVNHLSLDIYGGAYNQRTAGGTIYPIISPVLTMFHTYELTAGITYYLRLYSVNGTLSSYDIGIEKLAAGEILKTAYPLTLGSNATQNYDSLADGSEVWFKFVPGSSADYSFTLIDAGKNYTYTLYEHTGYFRVPSSGEHYSLEGGSVYYLYFTDITDNDDFGIIVETVE